MDAYDPDDPRLPIEQAWSPSTMLRTLERTVLRPRAAFHRWPQPLPHGRVVAWLALLRAPGWCAAVLWLALTPATLPFELRPAHLVIEPRLARVLEVWLLWMVPVGVPLLYFVAGITGQIGLALTGGARRSVGASMRAVGYAVAPFLGLLGLLDLAVHSGAVAGWMLLASTAALVLGAAVHTARVLAITHQIAVVRALAIAALPVLLMFAGTLARYALVLRELPGVVLVEPSGGTYVPTP